MPTKRKFKLIVSVVQRGYGDHVVEASKHAGAEGGTILPGRGTGIHDKKSIFGIPIQPEKDIVLTIVHDKLAESVLKKIVEEAQLDVPGSGIGFILDIDRLIGVVHHTD